MGCCKTEYFIAEHTGELVRGTTPPSWKIDKYLLFPVKWDGIGTIYFPCGSTCRVNCGIGEGYQVDDSVYCLIGFTPHGLNDDGEPMTLNQSIIIGAGMSMLKMENSIWMLDEEPGE